MSRFRRFIYEKSRIEAFSDGVLAIVITLLVLEIKVPHTGEAHRWGNALDVLWAQRGELAGWIISFMMVGVIWLQHHNIMHMCSKIDLGMVWINLFVLMCQCILPFTSGFLGENPGDPAVISLFSLEAAIGSLSLVWLYWYGTRHYLKPTYDARRVRRNVRLAFVAPLLYVIAALSSWLHPAIAYGILILLPLIFIFPLDTENVGTPDAEGAGSRL